MKKMKYSKLIIITGFIILFSLILIPNKVMAIVNGVTTETTAGLIDNGIFGGYATMNHPGSEKQPAYRVGKLNSIYWEYESDWKCLYCVDKGATLRSEHTGENAKYDITATYLLCGFPQERLTDFIKNPLNYVNDTLKILEYEQSSAYPQQEDEYRLAYILSKKVEDGEKNKKSVSNAIWKSSLNKGDKVSSSGLYTEATAYSNYKKNYIEPIFDENLEVKNNNGIIGPFKVSYSTIGGTYQFGQIQAAYIEINGTQYPIATSELPSSIPVGNKILEYQPQGLYQGLDDKKKSPILNVKTITPNILVSAVQSKVQFVDVNGIPLTSTTGLDSDTITVDCLGYPKPNIEFYIKLDDDLKNADVNNLNFLFNNVNAQAYFSYLRPKNKIRTESGDSVTPQSLIIPGGIRTTTVQKLSFGLEDPKKFKIQGMVWEDVKSDKTLKADGIKDIKTDGDKVLEEKIKVYLYDIELNKRIATTETNNGEYAFSNLEPKRYRVEFEYNGLTYAPTQKDTSISVITENNTKDKKTSYADEEQTGIERRNFNNKFNNIIKNKAIGSTGEQLNLTYAGEIIGNRFTSTLNKKDANGISLQEYKMQAYSTEVNLKDVKIPDGVEELVVENVNLGLVRRYEATLALFNGLVKSEVWYNGTHLDKDKTYGKDEQNRINEILLNPEELSQLREKQYNVDIDQEDIRAGTELYLTYMVVIQNNSKAVGTLKELVEYYDKNLDLISAWYGGNANGGGTTLTPVKELDIANYRTARLVNTAQTDIIEGNSITIYFKFKMTDIENLFKLGTSVEKVVNSEISQYSFNSTKNLDANINSKLTTIEKEKFIKSQIDKNSAPENWVDRPNKNILEDDEGNGPRVYLRLIKYKNIGGTAWEDVNKDGIRQDSEAKIKNMTVDLYQESNKTTPIQTDITDNEGKYLFENLANGKYIVRFKYGNTNEIVKISGHGGANAKSYNGADFESTILNVGADDKDSDAQDNGTRKTEVQNYTKLVTNAKYRILTAPYNDPTNTTAITTLINNTWMYADTGTIEIVDAYSSLTGGNVDFGLKEKPETKLRVEKRVTSIKIADRNNTTLVNVVIPKNQAPQGTGAELVKQIPDVSNPYQYNIELGTEILTGSKVEIGYEIKIINDSDMNVTVKKLFDYIDNDMIFNTTNNAGWKEVLADELSNSIDSSIKNKIGSNVVAKTEADIALAAKATTTKNMILSATLSSDLKEISYVNSSEIAEYETSGRVDKNEIPANKQGRDMGTSEEVTINDATGEQRIYYTLGIFLLLSFTTGIIMIKKKTLNKEISKK